MDDITKFMIVETLVKALADAEVVRYTIDTSLQRDPVASGPWKEFITSGKRITVEIETK